MAQKENKDFLVNDKALKKIGSRLKSLRKAKGYSNPDKFAYENDLNRSQYGKYESGNTNLTIGTLINILNKLEIGLSEFFNEEFDQL